MPNIYLYRKPTAGQYEETKFRLETERLRITIELQNESLESDSHQDEKRQENQWTCWKR